MSLLIKEEKKIKKARKLYATQTQDVEEINRAVQKHTTQELRPKLQKSLSSPTKIKESENSKQRHKDELFIEDVLEETENESSKVYLQKLDGDGASSYRMPASSVASSMKNSCLESSESDEDDELEDDNSSDEDSDEDESDYSLADSYDTEVANVHEFENNLEKERNKGIEKS